MGVEMSRIFISLEAHISISGIIHDAIMKIESVTGIFETTDYTNALDSIGIYVNCFDEEWRAKGYGKDRKYISYKNRYADIRLNIPAEDLLAADKKERFLMVKNNIIDSIKVIDERLNKKKGCSFDGKRLIEYIEERTANLV